MADVRVDACRGKALTVLVLVFIGGAASGVIGSHVFQSVVTTTPVVTTQGDLPAPHSDALHRLSQELLLAAAGRCSRCAKFSISASCTRRI